MHNISNVQKYTWKTIRKNACTVVQIFENIYENYLEKKYAQYFEYSIIHMRIIRKNLCVILRISKYIYEKY